MSAVALLLALSTAHASDGLAPAGAEHEDVLPGSVDLDPREMPIINGEPAAKGDFPMTGGLLLGGTVSMYGFEIDGKLLMCSSTLIAPDVVLLAAHCVDVETMMAASGMSGLEILDQQFAWSRRADLSEYQLTNEAIMNPPEWPGDVVFATEVVAHPDFDIYAMGLGLSKNYDIALMFLEEPVLDVPYAILPTPEEDDQLEVGLEVDIVGWGQQTSDQQPPPGTVGFKMWGTSYINETAPYEFQVGGQVEDVRKCHGDSGGPTFAYLETDSTEAMRLVGVTSHSYDFTDCNLKGGVDTRVGFYLDWIEQEMASRCEDGTRAWCDWPGIIPPPDENGLMAWEQDTGDGEEESAKGCGCSAAGSAAGWLPMLLVAPLLLRRRR